MLNNVMMYDEHVNVKQCYDDIYNEHVNVKYCSTCIISTRS